MVPALLSAGTIFPMNREGESYKCDDFAQLLAEHGVDVPVIVAVTRGDLFLARLMFIGVAIAIATANGVRGKGLKLLWVGPVPPSLEIDSPIPWTR